MYEAAPFILTKIIATVGPSCLSRSTLVCLIEEGVRVFRINFSHGQVEDFKAALDAVRWASSEAGIPVGVLGDLSGPKIRVGQVRKGGIELEAGQQVVFQKAPVVADAGDDPGAPVVFSTTYPGFIGDVEPGHRLLIDDGALRLTVVDKPGTGDDQRLVASVTIGGLVTSSKGINLPDTDVSAPSLTEHDLRCVGWAVEQELDFLALSFVRRAEDVRQLKKILATKATQAAGSPGCPGPIPVVAKIEKPQALEELDEIVDVTDALMVARGDLGVEMDLARLPAIQKQIIALARDHGKPVIVATQMLQSMIDAASPTRAEVSDVANAIYDGAGAVMLSGETAVGRYPIQAVRMMAQIARAAQEDLVASGSLSKAPKRLQETHYRTAALAHGVNVVVEDLKAKLMGVWSQLGGGARYLSQNRPHIPIIAASSLPAVLRRMTLLFGVIPVLMDPPQSLEDFADKIDALIRECGWAVEGDQVVLLAGEPIGVPGVTNTLLIRNIRRVCRVPSA